MACRWRCCGSRVAGVPPLYHRGIKTHRASVRHLGKNLPEWTEEAPLGRPVCDCENNLLEATGKRTFERCAKIHRCAERVIAKSPATPCPENQGRVTMRMGDREDAMDALLQKITRCGLADVWRVGGRACDET